ncbi:MAG: NAAT family transporter [Pigmentiphaga sp.]|nr:NAAT family transporter [Pigmentiphaga sp.]
MLTDLMLAFGKSALFALATILPILNPAATAPIFLSLTRGASASVRQRLAMHVARNVFLMLCTAMLVGSFVLAFFGISLPIVRIGGGLLVVATAWRLVNASDTGSEAPAKIAENFTPDDAIRKAFYPLTFPLSCGPGSIAAAITVGASLRSPSLLVSGTQVSGALLGLAAVGLVIFLCFRFAENLLKPLGETGIVVFLRLSAFILLCLGVQIIWEGASELMLDMMARAA